MALKFIDSMAHYGTNLSTVFERKWTNVNLVSWEASGGRRNAPYLNIFGGGLLKTIARGTHFIQGAAIGNVIIPGPMLTLAINVSSVVSLNLNDDATISVLGGTVELGKSGFAVTDVTAFHYYEMDATIGAAGGTYTATATIVVDGFTFGTFSGATNVPTSLDFSASNSVNGIGFLTNGTYSVMDYYCIDTSNTDINGNATTNTALLGDVEIDALFPATDVTTGWGTVGGDGTHAYSVINQSPSGDDSDYVYTTNTNTTSEGFNYQSIASFSGTILGAQYLVCARKDAEGTRVIAMTVGANTCTSINFLATTQYLSDYYVYFITPLDTDFGTTWTDAVYDAEVFGFTLID